MSGLKNITGRGRGVSQGGGKGEGRGKGGVKVTNSKEKENGVDDKAEDLEGERESRGEKNRGDAGAEPASQLGLLGLGPTENRIEGNSTGEESQRKLEQESGRQI